MQQAVTDRKPECVLADCRFQRTFDAQLHPQDCRRCCTLCIRTRVACAEQAGIEVVAVLHDAATSGTEPRQPVMRYAMSSHPCEPPDPSRRSRGCCPRDASLRSPAPRRIRG
jgi:hypothetical protein